jgi:hypothetical protein
MLAQNATSTIHTSHLARRPIARFDVRAGREVTPLEKILSMGGMFKNMVTNR